MRRAARGATPEASSSARATFSFAAPVVVGDGGGGAAGIVEARHAEDVEARPTAAHQEDAPRRTRVERVVGEQHHADDRGHAAGDDAMEPWQSDAKGEQNGAERNRGTVADPSRRNRSARSLTAIDLDVEELCSGLDDCLLSEKEAIDVISDPARITGTHVDDSPCAGLH